MKKVDSNKAKFTFPKFLRYTLPVVFLIIGGVAYMTLAEEDAGSLSSTDKAFLLEAADTRMMDWAQGNLATEKSQSSKYQVYGKRLMKDQNTLMEELKALAAAKNITLPSEISEKKSQELAKMKSISGETFERRFRRMIIKDHKRDIDYFTRTAETSTDPDIRDFAKRYLPVMEQHLELARDLNK